MIKKNKFIIFIFALFSLFLLNGCVDNENNGNDDPVLVSIFFDTKILDVSVETLTGYPGDNVLEPSDPTSSGLTFSHWTHNGQKYDFSVFPNESIILEAVWLESYHITFDTNDSTQTLDSIVVGEGEKLDNLPQLTPKVENNSKIYQFTGWTYNGVSLPFTEMPAMDILLVAQWEETTGIIFDVGNSETLISPLIAESNKKITAPQIEPTLDGYIFTGWNFLNSPYVFDRMPNTTIILTANYINATTNLNSMASLAKMYINLEDNFPLNNVVRESYVNSTITLISPNDDDSFYNISSEFKGRGHGSWDDSGPKKGYRLKFFSRQSLFGESANRHWAIIAGANFYDTTLSRNSIAYSLGQDVFTNIEWNSSTHWFELYVNHEYRGVYVLIEHVRDDEDRVNVNPEFGVLDTGYMIEYDAYGAEGIEGINYFRIPNFRYPFSVRNPDPDDYIEEGITETQYRAQINYIKEYTNTALNAGLSGNIPLFMEYVDINSFIDMYILHELLKNSDTGWSSFHLYKKAGGKLYAGPAWDFDASAGNSRGDSSYTGFYVSDTVRQHSEHTANYLFIYLMQNSVFKQLVKERWLEISADVKVHVNNFYSNEFIETNKFAFARNFVFWSNPYGHYSNVQATAETQWTNNVNNLKNWIINRADWLDNNF